MSILTDKFKNISQSRYAPLAAISFSVLFWGISFMAVKVAVNEIPPFTMALARFLIASIVLAFVLLNTKREKINKKDFLYLGLCGFLGISLYTSLENYGTLFTNASNTAIITALIPVLGVITDRFLYKYTLSIGKILGIVLSIVGVYIIIAVQGSVSFSRDTFLGNAILIIANFVWIAYLVSSKTIEGKYSDLTITTFQILFGTLLLLPMSATEYHSWHAISTAAILSIFFLGIFCSAAAFFMYLYAVRKLGVTVTSVYLNLSPVIGVIVGFLVLGERLAPLQILGGIIVLAGVMIVSRNKAPVEFDSGDCHQA